MHCIESQTMQQSTNPHSITKVPPQSQTLREPISLMSILIEKISSTSILYRVWVYQSHVWVYEYTNLLNKYTGVKYI